MPRLRRIPGWVVVRRGVEVLLVVGMVGAVVAGRTHQGGGRGERVWGVVKRELGRGGSPFQ